MTLEYRVRMSDHQLKNSIQRIRIYRKDLVTTLLHLAWIVGVVISTMTGLQIWRIQQDDALAVIGFLDWLAWQGEALYWHMLSAVLITLSVFGYFCFLAVLRQMGRLSPWQQIDTQTHGKRARKQLQPRRLFNLLAILLLLVMVISGWTLQRESVHLPNAVIQTIHGISALCLFVFVIIHLLLHLKALGIKSACLLWWPQVRFVRRGIFALSLTLSFVFIMSWLAEILPFSQPLHASHTQQPPRIDGFASDSIWSTIQPVHVIAKNGSGDHAQTIEIAIKAVHDGERIYLLLAWDDSSHSLQHLPLEKNSNGWHVLNNGFEQDDEIEFYEDKFAVMLSKDLLTAALESIHLGSRVLKGAPAPRHGRGYHFFERAQSIDIWHWKAVRTDPLFQADDSHFGRLYPVRECDARYTAGYQADSKKGGGYSHNWIADSAYSPQTIQAVTPKRLPRSSRFVRVGQRSENSSPSAPMRYSDSTPYSEGLDRFSDGSRIPSLLKYDAITGDRGGVAAKGSWSQGQWHLELSRSLDSDSAQDVAIDTGTYLWFAPFDHAQTRHAYHLRPLRLQLGDKP